MRVIVKKWGNSAGVRIPSSVLAASGLAIDQAVDVREEAGRVIIDPVKPKDYDLATLLSGITRENVHEEADYGPAIGQELL
jgi:Growth regulator